MAWWHASQRHGPPAYPKTNTINFVLLVVSSIYTVADTMVSKEEVEEIEAELLGARFGLRPIIAGLILFHIAALLFYVILLIRGNRPVKKLESKQH